MGVITKQELLDASVDAQALEDIVNGDANRSNPGHPDGTVTTRLGSIIKTIANIISGIGTVQETATASAAVAKTAADRAEAAASKIDSTSSYSAWGGDLILGFFDSSRRVIAGWLADGIMRGRIGVISALNQGHAFNYDPATGLTSLNFSTQAVYAVDQYINNQRIAVALLDPNKRIWWAAQDDGYLYVPKLKTDTLVGADGLPVSVSGGASIAAGGGYYFSVEVVSGKQQIMRYSQTSGLKTQATSTGNNTAPLIDAEGQNIFYRTDRVTPAVFYYQPVAGGREAPVFPTRVSYVGWGNSLSTITYYPVAMANTTLPEGVGGQNHDHVLARMNAMPLTCQIPGNSVPASGACTPSNFLPNIWFHWNTTTGSYKAVIIGSDGTRLPCVLTFNSGALSLIRNVAGAAMPVPNPAYVEITSGRVEGSVDPTGAPDLDDLLNRPAILLLNYNSITQLEATGYTASDMINGTVTAFNRLQTKIKHVLVSGDYYGQSRLTAAQAPGYGTAATGAISRQLIDLTKTVNSGIQAALPAFFIPMHDLLVAGGHSSVFSVQGVNEDIIDTATLADGTHPGTTGRATIAGIYDAAINSRTGWSIL